MTCSSVENIKVKVNAKDVLVSFAARNNMCEFEENMYWNNKVMKNGKILHADKDNANSDDTR